MSAGVERSIEASEAIEKFYDSLKRQDISTLKGLDFAVNAMRRMPHHILGGHNMNQKTIEARLIRLFIQAELERRGEAFLSYGWEDMFNAMGVKDAYTTGPGP
jgi:hypothetical protein